MSRSPGRGMRFPRRGRIGVPIGGIVPGMDIAPAATEPRTSKLPLLAAVLSALTAGVGLWWLLRPAQYPFTPDPVDPAGTLLDLVSPALVPPALVLAGMAGLVVAGLAGSGRARVWSWRRRRRGCWCSGSPCRASSR
ncbi:hypothetical protein BJF90_36850 [Pseudonocardia sp. CNS-004]|nr:hypothetical protein BJF90_36850 [Pseudonocardia sp. CNS-004]